MEKAEKPRTLATTSSMARPVKPLEQGETFNKMLKKSLNLRNVAAIATCLAGMTMFSGCDKDPNEENGGEDDITITAKVYVGEDVGENKDMGGRYAPYIAYTGNVRLHVGDNELAKIGTAEIKGGTLNLTLGIPKNPQKMDESPFIQSELEMMYPAAYTSITYSDPNAKCDILRFTIQEWGVPFSYLEKTNYTSSHTATTSTITRIEVLYVYVDRDVTINATGINNFPRPSSVTNNDVRLPLRKGWNEVHRNYVYKTFPDYTETVFSWEMGDNGCNWVLFGNW